MHWKLNFTSGVPSYLLRVHSSQTSNKRLICSWTKETKGLFFSYRKKQTTKRLEKDVQEVHHSWRDKGITAAAITSTHCQCSFIPSSLEVWRVPSGWATNWKHKNSISEQVTWHELLNYTLQLRLRSVWWQLTQHLYPATASSHW